jgi:hypothetical protein
LSPPHEQLIVFTRYPEPGHTKTRLIPVLGPDGAAALQRQMTEHVIDQVVRLLRRRPLTVEIRFGGGSDRLMRNWLGSGFLYGAQGGGGLGRRMAAAMAAAFDAGAQSAVITGTDIPGITAEILERAFDALGDTDAVYGPAVDGGYYLVGLRRGASGRALPKLFTGLPWGSERVLTLSTERARELALSVATVDTLADVDRPEDLAVWERFAGPPISVVIPTLNEAGGVAKTVRRAKDGRNVEVIVADGGSQDDTTGIAAGLGARVLATEPPRARQMNAGAAAATGDILIFLHADTHRPAGFEGCVRRSLSRDGVVAGAFALGIDSPRVSLRLMERVADWRSRCLRTPYGDQALYITTETFRSVGGFPELPIMEDFELVRRLRKIGRIDILTAAVHTSARRWRHVGVWKTWLVNQVAIVAYLLGVDPGAIARFYNRERGLGARRTVAVRRIR